MQDLAAEAQDSVSIRVRWRSPAQPNGLITRYRLQVLVDEVQLQDITLTAGAVRQMSGLCTQHHQDFPAFRSSLPPSLA